MDGWLPAIFSFVFLIVACSTPPFLFFPLPFVCLVLLLSIWLTIDKTQSLTMLGTQQGLVAAVHMHCDECVCSGFRKGMGCGLHTIVYLPFYFQMALSREIVILDILSFSLLPH